MNSQASTRVRSLAPGSPSFLLVLLPVVLLPLILVFPERGIVALHHDNREWRGKPVLSRTEKGISLDGAGPARADLPHRNFSVTWGGWVRIDEDGEHVFSTISDDGSALFVDDRRIVQNGGFHGPRRASGTVHLTRGAHHLKVLYFQGGGDYSIEVLWKPPGGVEGEIPGGLLYPAPPSAPHLFLARHLGSLWAASWALALALAVVRSVRREGKDLAVLVRRHAGKVPRVALGVALAFVVLLPLLLVLPERGLLALYHGDRDWGGTPIARRIEKGIGLDTVSRDPASFPQRNFSVSWSGWIRIDDEGEYSFSTISDDGSSLYVDDRRIVQNGGFHGLRRASGTVKLAGGLHRLKILYFQGGGDYSIEVLWKPPGGEEGGIPPRLVYPAPPAAALVALARSLGTLWVAALVAAFAAGLGPVAHAGMGNLGGLARRFAKRLAFSTVVLLAFLVLAEVAIRAVLHVRSTRRDLAALLDESERAAPSATARTHSLKGIVRASRDPRIVYELKPRLSGNLLGAPFFTNADGLRDSEHAKEKPEGVFRIAGLGDSSLFGWGVRAEDVSLEVLEQRLNESSGGRRFEVINFAVPGYNTALEAETFAERSVDWSPDLALVNFNTNDYDVPGFLRLEGPARLVRESYVLDFLYARLEAFRGSRRADIVPFEFADRTVPLGEAERLDEDPALPAEFRWMVGVKGFERAMRRLAEAAGPRGIPVVVFDIFPYPGLHPSYGPHPLKESQFEVVSRACREHGFHLLNTYPYYTAYMDEHPGEDYPRAFWVTATDSHPSPLAHRINAEALYEFLTARGLVPEAP